MEYKKDGKTENSHRVYLHDPNGADTSRVPGGTLRTAPDADDNIVRELKRYRAVKCIFTMFESQQME